MNDAPMNIKLSEALRRADIAALDEIAETIGAQAVAVAIAQPMEPLSPPTRPVGDDEDRQRLLDEALADAAKVMERHRNRLGRRVTSRHDATVMRQVFELLRSMAGSDGGCDSDANFQ